MKTPAFTTNAGAENPRRRWPPPGDPSSDRA